jgi:phosphate transport system substrate-binding protein
LRVVGRIPQPTTRNDPRRVPLKLTTSRRWTAYLAVPLAGALLLGACSSDDDDSGSDDDGSSGDSASGTLVISGSSTVEPITVDVADKFLTENPDVEASVDGPGTGDGFELFCEGETDINDASSKIKEEQIEACESNGIEFIELRIGNDGIAVMTNEANEAVECLAVGDLYGLSGPESQGIDTWEGANELATEVGGNGDMPDAPLAITGPGEESGTYSSYVELALEDIAEEREQPAESRPDYQASADDNVIIQGIQGSDTSFGWVGFAFARDAEGVKVLEVDGGDGCVAPTDETIADNTYPLSRPLFIYVNKAKAEENQTLSDFVDFYLNDSIASVSDVGYVDLSEETLNETRERWESMTTGAA